MAPDGEKTDQVVSIHHKDPLHSEVVLVDWMLGNSCNQACSYCPPALHDGSVRWQAAQDVLAFFATLQRHYADTFGRTVWLQFTGGEPTLHPQIKRLLAEARLRNFRTSLISNGSRTLRFWEQALYALDGVILTYHDEFVDHDHFLTVCRLLAEAMPIHVNITVHPDRFDAILDRAEEIGETVPHATISLKPLRVDFGDLMYSYSADQLARLERRFTCPDIDTATLPRSMMVALGASGRREALRANEFILRRRNRWRGYLCEAGLESLRIHADGQIFRATCGVGGLIGRLEEKVSLPVSPILCDQKACACVADILITKQAGEYLDAECALCP